MATDRTDSPPLEEPLAELERRIIDEYIRGLGHDPDHLRASTDPISCFSYRMPKMQQTSQFS